MITLDEVSTNGSTVSAANHFANSTNAQTISLTSQQLTTGSNLVDTCYSFVSSIFYSPFKPLVECFGLDYNLFVLNLFHTVESFFEISTSLSRQVYTPNQTNESLITTRPNHLSAIQSADLAHAYSSHELATDYRFQKTQNPIFRYDFRVGHYMTDNTKILNQHMFTTFNDVTTGLRRAP
jgi:hypothetical protein